MLPLERSHRYAGVVGGSQIEDLSMRFHINENGDGEQFREIFLCVFMLDSIEQLLRPDRFTQVSVHPCIEAPPAITACRESCEGNDRNVPAPFYLPYTNG